MASLGSDREGALVIRGYSFQALALLVLVACAPATPPSSPAVDHFAATVARARRALELAPLQIVEDREIAGGGVWMFAAASEGDACRVAVVREHAGAIAIVRCEDPATRAAIERAMFLALVQP